MAYATIADIKARISYEMTEAQEAVCESLLHDAAVIINAYNTDATVDAKKVVSCRMVIRAIGNGADGGMPIGATQGTVSALGYSQTFTYSAGSVGELYLSKLDKKLLGCSKIGSHSPVEDLAGGAIND